MSTKSLHLYIHYTHKNQALFGAFHLFIFYMVYTETEKAPQVPPAQGAYGTEVPDVDAAEGTHAAAPADARSICSTLTRYRFFFVQDKFRLFF